MTLPKEEEWTTDVPAQVFEKFLQELAAAGVSTELVKRLHKVLLEEKVFTERALTAAIFGEEPLL
jgi:hypothetical protein